MDANKGDIGYLVNVVGRSLRSVLAEGLRNHGLDDAGYVVLVATYRAGEDGMTTRGLAEGLGLRFEDVAAMSERLEHAGWLVQERDPADEASRVLRLTHQTEAVLPLLKDAAHWTLERGLSGFGDDEVAQLTGFLNRIRENLR